MNVTFYTFSKKLNSTKRPSGGTGYSCTLKRGSSKMAPYIELSAADPTNYNYAYIPAYGRYYYIDNWTFQDGLWSCDMSVDVLATFKTEIGSANLYVLRASEEWDRKVVDTIYPTTLDGSGDDDYFNSGMVTQYSNGSYVLGVISKAAAHGAVAYYVLSYSDMATLRQAMMTQMTVPDWGTDWNIQYPNITGELIKSLINPFQYVASCMWIPCAVPSAGTYNVDFGFWDSGIVAGVLDANVITVSTAFQVPQLFVGRYDEYRRISPYTRYQVFIPPFGCIDLDSSVIVNDTTINCTLKIDPITGAGHLEIIGDDTKHVYAALSAQVGAQVQIAQMSSDVLGAATSLINGVTDAVTGAMTGDIAGAIKGGVNGIADSVRSAMPTVSTSGGNGGIASINQFWRFSWFTHGMVQEDKDLNGRPLCKTRTPAALGGYIVARDGSVVDCAGSKEEKTELKSFIETGFYYE